MRSPLGGVVEDEHLGPGISVRMVAGDPRCTGWVGTTRRCAAKPTLHAPRHKKQPSEQCRAGASALAAENQQLKQEVEALKQLLGDVGSCGPGGAGSVRRHLAQLAQLQRQVGRLQVTPILLSGQERARHQGPATPTPGCCAWCCPWR
jgi:hypothetical protein